ncbi:hypothetical protein GGS23DRAFT_148486 [Durotheca rogersii]|uniref:uncharacterized protein n=1 Tax=Durotheca rogersii TaxID=419775 RepID=UPI00221E64FA|nr:uncharacterized protein GGS23DRAFT_148486 [Durotheca rogersii]KAI5861377.1 hypothetical protein GGS23DRAFT_148486 [Durotheca rogersii]
MFPSIMVSNLASVPPFQFFFFPRCFPRVRRQTRPRVFFSRNDQKSNVGYPHRRMCDLCRVCAEWTDHDAPIRTREKEKRGRINETECKEPRASEPVNPTDSECTEEGGGGSEQRCQTRGVEWCATRLPALDWTPRRFRNAPGTSEGNEETVRRRDSAIRHAMRKRNVTTPATAPEVVSRDPSPHQIRDARIACSRLQPPSAAT